MAKQIEDIIVKLGIQGFEGLDKIRSSFRDLSKVTSMSERDINTARASLFEFAKTAGNTEAVNKGLTSALQALRTQVDTCGNAYKQLTSDLNRLNEVSRGSTDAVERQRNALLRSADASAQNAKALERQITNLERLRQQTRPGSSAFAQLTKDIDNATETLGRFKSVASAAANALTQAPGASLNVATAQIAKLQAQMRTLTIASDEYLRMQTRISLVEAASSRPAARQQVRAAAEMFSSTQYQRYAEQRAANLELPDTTAALNVELGELQRRLENTVRGSSAYINTAIRMAEIQRQLRADVMGTSEAFKRLSDAEAGTERRSAKLADIQAYYASQGPLAPGVGGFRDPTTGALIAAGARNPNRIRVNASAYPQPIGPQPFPEAAKQATAELERAYADMTRIQTRAGLERVELQAKFNQLQIDKLLEGLDLEGAARKKAFDTELADFDRRAAIADRRRGRRLTGMQLAQGVGAALSGGIFGGPEGLLGGLGGLAVGGVGGAFAGAAFGAQVGMVRQQIGVFTEQAAAISKLRIGLASVSTDLREFEASTRAVEGASQSLLIPLADTYRYYTQLRASTVELNYSANDTRQILEGTASAVFRTGGSLADVDGAMRAVVQILSKGKVAAEEVRGQLGERFPGAVIKFAQANRMSVQELDQAFQAGSVTIEQFITFARKNYKDGGKYAEILADSTEYAGRRMEKALESMRLAVGRSLKESGAGFQNFAAETAESLLWLGQQLYAFGDAAERALGGTPSPTGNAKEIAERIIGGGTTVAAIEEAIRTYEGKVQEAKDRLNAVKTRNILQFIFDETFGQGTPTQQQTGKTVASFESRIQSLREALKLADDYTRRGKRGAGSGSGSGSEDRAAADRAKSLLSAIEQREEALAQARIQREEQIAEIRKQAIEQARQLERQFADERTAVERDIAKNRRELNDLQASAQLSFRAETTQNPFLVDAERGISEILRRSREERIRIDAEYSDKQTQRARLLADFQKKVADDINKANETYARQIGNIQREYAKNVAKIVEEGTGAAGKRLEVSSKIAALYMQRASLNAVVAQATGVVVSEPDKKGENVVTAGTLLNSRIGAPAQLPIRSIIQIDEQLQQLQGRLQQLAPSLPAAPAVGPVRPLPRSQQIDIPSLSALDRATAEQRGTAKRLVTEQEADAIRNRFISITEESNKQVQNLQEQNTLLNLQAKYLSTGVNTELARQFAQEELSYSKRKARLDTERQEAIRQGLDVQAINTLYEGRLSILNDQYSVLMRQTEELDKQQRLLRLRQDSDIGAGIREGAQKYVESIGTMREATAQLAQTGIKGVEDAIFSLTTTGKANFQEFAKSILENTARMIIQQLILRSVMQIIGAIGGGPKLAAGAGQVSSFNAAAAQYMPNALGNAYAANGIQPFAMGGIVKRPTMFAFANGGAGRLGLMGEAGPEAIMPLRRLPNGRLGVEQAGGGTPVTVNVSVDASGTAVQGDAGQGEQLGRVVAQAVQAELIKQRRPGGLLNR